MRQFVSFVAAATLFVLATIPSSVRAEGDGESMRVERINTLVADRVATEKNNQPTVSAAAPEESSLGASGLRVFEGLVLCIAVLCIGIFLYRKITGVKPLSNGRRLRMIERIALAPKTALVLAEVDGREIVLAVGSEHVAFMDIESRGYQEREYLCETENEQLHTVS